MEGDTNGQADAQQDLISQFDPAAFRTAALTLAQSTASQNQQHMMNVVGTAELFFSELLRARARIAELEAELVIKKGELGAATKSSAAGRGKAAANK